MAAEAFDFAWPQGLIGRSSAWFPGQTPEATMLHPAIAPRRLVGLAPRWRSLGLGVDRDGRPDDSCLRATRMVIKITPAPGLAQGLSSGASSALVREPDGAVVRIKRCGFATQGVGGRNGHVGRIGLMGLAEALQECRMLALYRSQGLCPACEPIGVEILTDEDVPFFRDRACGVVRVRVESDVRADEWFLKLLTETLGQVGLPQPALRIEAGERIELANVAEALSAIQKSDLGERTFELGRASGGLLRAVHDAGMLRGRGSVWMGNDVIGADGLLSAIDCDGGAMHGDGSFGTMKRIEAADYAAGFADCFSWGQPDWLAALATLMLEGFWEGYRSMAPARVDVGA